MSASIIVSPAAERDIRAILDDLETEAGPLVADRYADKFEQAFATLAFTPGLGAPRPNMGTWTRQTLVQPYQIFYDGGPDSDVVRILRIVHGSRKITAEMIGRGR